MSRHFGEVRSLLAQDDKRAWASLCRYVSSYPHIFRGAEGEMLLQYLRESLQDRHPEKYAPLADLSWVLAKNPALFFSPRYTNRCRSCKRCF